MLRKQTLTISECLDVFRANLISLSQDSLTAGIQKGIFPFADCISPNGGRMVYLIYRKPLYEWLQAHVEVDVYREI